MDARLAHHANVDVSDYDQDTHHPRIAESLITGLLPVEPPGLLVDIATGTGAAAFLALRTLAPRRVLAVDISPGMIEQARRKAAGLDPSGAITWQLGPAHPLDLADATADVVICTSAMHFLGAPALREARRVLRPGGRLAFSIPSGIDLRPSPALRALMPDDLTLPASAADAAGLATAAGFVEANATLTAPAALDRPRRQFLVHARLSS